jgi:hypothetical protein
MNIPRLTNSLVKGLIGAVIAVGFTSAVHVFLFPSTDFLWALTAVSIGSFFSGFFAERSESFEFPESDRRKLVKEEKLILGFALVSLSAASYTVEKAVLPTILFLIAAGILFYSAIRE